MAGSLLPLGLSALCMAAAAATYMAEPLLVPRVQGSTIQAPALPEVVPPPAAATAPAAPDTQAGPVAASRARRLPGLGPGGPEAPAPAGPREWLSVPSVHLEIAVVDYGDCSGNTAMTRASAVHYLCTPGAVTTLVGHNPGVFTPLLNTHPGDLVVYRVGGVTRTLQMRGSSRVSPGQAASATQDASFTHMVLATCAAADSSSYWVFIAVPVDSGGPASSDPTTGAGAGPGPAPSPSPSPSGLLPIPIRL